MKYKKIPADTFKKLALNAGILLKAFTPSSADYQESDLLGATTGGCTFKATPDFKDYGDGVDNCPKNTMELKRINDYDVSLSGTFIAIDANLCKRLVAAADNTAGHIVPRKSLKDTDFNDIWIVCDYSEYNGETKGGYVAIHLMNALNTAGFQMTTKDEEKNTFAFAFTGHYSIEEQDKVPFEVYIKEGEAES